MWALGGTNQNYWGSMNQVVGVPSSPCHWFSIRGSCSRKAGYEVHKKVTIKIIILRKTTLNYPKLLGFF